MPIQETIVLSNDDQCPVEIKIINENEVYFGNADEDFVDFFFTITRDDWEVIKKFIDTKFYIDGKKR